MTLVVCRAALAAFFAMMAISAPGQDKMSSRAIFPSIERKLTAYVYGGPENFFSMLRKLGAGEEMVAPLPPNRQPGSADVWVFFVQSVEEIPTLPGPIQELYSRLGSGFDPEQSTSSALEFFTADGQLKWVIFHFPNNFSERWPQETIDCRLAFATIATITRVSGDAFREKVSFLCPEPREGD